MKIGIPKEIKNHEYRVGLSPASVRELVTLGHEILLESNAGIGIGATDEIYKKVGARICSDPSEIFIKSEMIIKVKEPQEKERAMLNEGQILFTYLHLAPDAQQTSDLVNSGAICIAYETVTSPQGGLPLLAPMSKVAGRMSIQAGAYCLEHSHGGLGILLGGVPGVDPAKIVVLGAGVVGTHAAHIAVGMGADVWVIDKNPDALETHWQQFGRSTNTVFSTEEAIEEHVINADLVIGGVLTPGAATPKLVNKDVVKSMKPGAVIVDVAIDQGGCCETSRPTTHDEPTYIAHDVVHYCVTNMPGGVPRTSTYSLNNVTLPHVINLATNGYHKALSDDPYLRQGLNICLGEVTSVEVATTHQYKHVPTERILGI